MASLTESPLAPLHASFRRRDLLRLAVALAVTELAPAWSRAEEARRPARRPVPTKLHFATKGDLLEFSTQQLDCPAASHVRVTFTNAAKYVNFDHNWVLLRPGTFDAVIAAAEQAGLARGWVPAGHPGIIAATTLAHRGQSVTVEFDAPPPGRYPYLCTVPGHANSMWGVLTVKPAHS